MAKRMKPENVQEYIKGFPKDVQLLLKKLRGAIRKNAPKTEERISYGIPGYFLNGMLIYFAGFKKHVSIYPVTASLRKTFGKELSPYLASKATLRFPLDEPLPMGLINRMVKFRVRENSKRK